MWENSRELFLNTTSGWYRCYFLLFFPLSDKSSDGLYTYERSDQPDVSTGRPTGNIFRNNEILNTVVGVKTKHADDTQIFVKRNAVASCHFLAG